MSTISEQLLAHTSKHSNAKALLVLADGTTYRGFAPASRGEVFGEVCFNTSMTGYLEVLTDPSYAGQIVAMTYPQIGNYGVCPDDVQRDRVALSGFVVHDMCTEPSNWRSQESLPDFLKRHNVVAIEGIDTRSLVRHIRETGAQQAVLSTEDDDVESLMKKLAAQPSLVDHNFVSDVSREQPQEYHASDMPQGHDFALKAPAGATHHVVVYDCGVKDGILEGLARSGCDLEIVPWNTPAEAVLAKHPDGVFVSNGPGDPDRVEGTYSQVGKLLGKVPFFGICLGHQMLSKACGARIEKLKYGHHGGNQPVENLLTGRVEITAQNHGFGQVFDSLGPLVPEESDGVTEHAHDLRFWTERHVAPVVQNDKVGRIKLTHVNLNDGTPEGMACLDIPAFSVQYHPEANPGPTDAHYLFTAFGRLMDGRDDYLDIDIAADRLHGWKFEEDEGEAVKINPPGYEAAVTAAAKRHVQEEKNLGANPATPDQASGKENTNA